MRRLHLPFFIFAMLFILTIPFPGDMATSVVPGWHTTVLTPYFLTTIGITLVLLFVTIAYWRLTRRVNKINVSFLVSHLLLTIPAVIFVRAPFLFFNITGADLTVLNRQITFTTALTAIIFLLFAVGQTLFAAYYLRTIYFKKATT